MSTDTEYEGLSIKPGEDRLISALNTVIRQGIRALAILMTLVIFWGIADVVWVIYQNMVEPPFLILRIEDILDTFGAFLAGLGFFYSACSWRKNPSNCWPALGQVSTLLRAERTEHERI